MCQRKFVLPEKFVQPRQVVMGVREILRVRKFDDRLGARIEDPGERRRRGLL